MKKNKSLIWVLITLFVAIIIAIALIFGRKNDATVVSVKSEKELYKIYNNSSSYDDNVFLKVLTFPFSSIFGTYGGHSINYMYDDIAINESASAIPSAVPTSATSAKTKGYSNTKSYSKTNVQVENVDEADINKTDGDYIYSITDNKVIITDIQEPSVMRVVSEIDGGDKVPVDLLLYEDKMVVIYDDLDGSSSSYNANTTVEVYNIRDRKNPARFKSFTLKSKYYTSRAIDGKLYIVANGRLRLEKNKDKTVDIKYTEDNNTNKIQLEDIQYHKNDPSKMQTMVAFYNLNTNEKIKVHSYLFNVSNVYASEENFYLLNEQYENGASEKSKKEALKSLYGPGGIFGFFNYLADDYYDYDYGYYTKINKLETTDKGDVKYVNQTEIEGSTINQFSMDEYRDQFRIALYSSGEGSRIVVFDKNLKQIGATDYIEENEKMYSTRFMGNRAYLVTFKNLDPLFVIDLSDGTNPKVLGSLEIPGYSTYLQAYDDTHIIGIGMDTTTTTNKTSTGRVLSTTTKVTGMKMALFDVSDVHNPKQIAETKIGNAYTTSAVLNNHKALLFSKEKNLIAIPVNTYYSAFSVTDSDNIETLVKNYTSYTGRRESEGYLVYDLDLENGFKLKGSINHSIPSTSLSSSGYSTSSFTSSSSSTSSLLRGLWVEDNLFTISEDAIKSNRLSDLKELDMIDLNNYVIMSDLQYEIAKKQKLEPATEENTIVENVVVDTNSIEE